MTNESREAVTSRQMTPPITSNWGIVVGPYPMNNGGVLWAEVEPTPKRNWRPLPGRMSRWWFEVHSDHPDEECGTTWAYTKGGSGGAFTFRQCVDKAMTACYHFAYEHKETEDAGK
jgi:hypothetical protein